MSHSFRTGTFAPPNRVRASVMRWLRTLFCLTIFSLTCPLGVETARAQQVKWGSVLATDYDRGVAEHKPIVVLFYDITTSRQDADRLSMQISLSATLGKRAGSAVWSFADISNNLVARNIAKALGITTFPTISVLRPDGKALDETFRIVGFLPVAATETGIIKGIEKASK